MDPPSLYSMQIVFDQNNYNESMARLHLYQQHIIWGLI